jgi:tetratricopeptide (TPR) repeat protein
MAKRFVKYNPSFLEEEHLIANFVVRHTDLELIVGIIGENVTTSNQHVLVIGPRGSGKTTLALRVAAELERREELRARWYPLIFSEESYEVVSAGEFWLEALFHLAEQTDDEKWKRIYADLKKEPDDQRLVERALGQLLDFADSQNKRILLIVENLNMLFHDLISPDEQWKIRHTLLNEPRIMMLATATTKFEKTEDLTSLRKMKSKLKQVAENRFVKLDNDANAMYEMFKIHELLPLNDDECNTIWELVAGQKFTGNRIRPLRILTGGNPRLLTIIAKFGAHRSFRQLLDDLVDLVDDHTEYFKSQLDSLPATERKVYLALAGLWSTSSARDISAAARLDVNKTSSLLNRLIGRGFVLVEEEGKKNKYYQIAERMYNIYYLMRRRGRPADRVKAAVKFMVSLYDPESATKMIAEEASGLSPEQCRDHRLAFEEAIMEVHDKQIIKEIIASTPKSLLESPYISDILKDVMAADKEVEKNEKASGEIDVEIKEAEEIIGQGFKLFKNGNYEQAIEKLNQAIRKFGNTNKEGVIAEVARAMVNKGVTLESLNRSEEAIQVFDEVIALYKNRPESEIAEHVASAMVNKGFSLGVLNRSEEAIQVYDEVIALYKDRPEPQIAERVARAMVNKGAILGVLNRSEEAIQVYDEVIALYKDRPEPQIAEGVVRAMVNKGFSLGVLNRSEEAIQVYDEVISLYKDKPEPRIAEGVARAMVNKGFRLGALKNSDEAEQAFIEAIEYAPNLMQAHIALIDLLLVTPERHEEALHRANEIINKRPQEAKLLSALAWVVYKHRSMPLLQSAEAWVRQAVSLAPENLNIQRIFACVLNAQGKGNESFEAAKKYIQDAVFVEKTIEDAIELFVELAASGYAKEALGILVNSPSEKHLEPLVVGLKLYIGEDVKTAVEILEVAKDVVKKIEERREKKE